MSFSSDVKEELSKKIPGARHCRIAELAALIDYGGHFETDDNGTNARIMLKTPVENAVVSRKYFTLWRKTFNINIKVSVPENDADDPCSGHFSVSMEGAEAIQVLETVKLIQKSESGFLTTEQVSPVVIQRNCCKRAFIRGAFLAAGSISDPEKFYHFEIVCQTRSKAEVLQTAMKSFSIDAKIVARKKMYVVYVKEGAQIVDLLGIMEANVALMNLENIRILKEMRNSINRKVNCEAANINKTVNASVRQTEDIRYLEAHMGLQSLGEGLEEVARLRLQYPDASLKELGEMLNPKVGKSGVNHRLRKISTIAKEWRVKQGGH